MHEKTECRYTYEPIKKGRSVVRIKFTVKTLPKVIIDNVESQKNIEQWQGEQGNTELWASAIEEFRFSQEQLEELRAILVIIPEDKLPKRSDCFDSIEIMQYHYLQIKAKEIKRRDSEKPIRNKFAYLLKLLKQDAK